MTVEYGVESDSEMFMVVLLAVDGIAIKNPS
jgi:hypothetical protein